MFGLSLKSRTRNVLKKDFHYPQIHPDHKPALDRIILEAKSLNRNEYDAAIMFMLVQMNALTPDHPGVASFVAEQAQNIENVISLAASPSSEISQMLNDVKAQHASISDSADTDSVGKGRKITEAITDLLAIQSSVFADNDSLLPEKAKDKWSLGYVGGFSDALLQDAGVGNDIEGSAIMAGVFIEVFGTEDGLIYFGNFMDLQQAGDSELWDGMQRGGEEMSAWLNAIRLNDPNKGPFAWSTHVLNDDDDYFYEIGF